MSLRACKRCRYGMNLKDPNGDAYVDCIALPPRPIVINNTLIWRTPPMNSNAKMGCFKLSWRKLIRPWRAS